MKRDPHIPAWYCACGRPHGYEAAVFHARGLAPLAPTKLYRRMAQLAGCEVELGHEYERTRGLRLWVPVPLARLIPSGIDMRTRAFLCVKMGLLSADTREEKLIELDVVSRLVGAEAGIVTVFGPVESSEALQRAWQVLQGERDREERRRW